VSETVVEVYRGEMGNSV